MQSQRYSALKNMENKKRKNLKKKKHNVLCKFCLKTTDYSF